MNAKLLASLLSILLLAVPLCAQDDDATVLPQNHFDDQGEAMSFGLQRGAANTLLGWLELPRNLSYEFTARPLSAIVTGPLMGITMTAMRTLFGTVDVLSAGYMGNYGYATAVPDYPWEGVWLSPTAELE